MNIAETFYGKHGWISICRVITHDPNCPCLEGDQNL